MLAHIVRKWQHLRHVSSVTRAGSVLAPLILTWLALGLSAMPVQAQEIADETLMRQVEAFAEAYDAGRYREAAELGSLALELSRQALGDDTQQTAFLMLKLAHTYLRLQEAAPARALFTELRAAYAGKFGDDHPVVLNADLGLAAAALIDKPAQASELYAAVVARLRAVGNADPGMLGNAELGLGRALRQAGDEEAALAAYTSAVETFAQSLGRYHPTTQQTRAAWATLQESPWIAADTLVESWRVLRVAFGNDHPETVRVGMAAAQTLLDLGLVFDALEIALPVAASAQQPTRGEALAFVAEAWQRSRQSAPAIRAIRAASPPEDAQLPARLAAAAHLATALVHFGRAVEAVLAIDGAHRLIGAAGAADPVLAEALALIANPQQAVTVSLDATSLLAEATAIVENLDPAHPQRLQLEGRIALARSAQAVTDSSPDQAIQFARAAVDRLTGADDPRGVLRLRLRLAMASAFALAGSDRLAAIAYNGIERDLMGAPGSLTESLDSAPALLLTPDEAADLLEACASHWRDAGAADRVAALETAIAGWRALAETWPAGAAPPDAAND